MTPTGYAQVAEEVVAGFVVRQYTHGLMRVSQRQNLAGTWTTSYYGYDGFGSTRQLLSAAGVVTDTFAFDGFGNLVARTGSTPNQYLYRGEALDAGTGMYYLRARWYRPMSGSFITTDRYEGQESDPGSLHLRGFARSNPIKYVDPSGNSFIEGAMMYSYNTPWSAYAGATSAATAVCLLGYPMSLLTYAALSGAYEIDEVRMNTCFFSARVRMRERDYRQILNKDPGPAPLEPPGDCTYAKQRELQNAVDAACKGPKRSCKGEKDCAVIGVRIGLNGACLAARLAINFACFRGGDDEHKNEVKEAFKALTKCYECMRTCK
ncbi:MAG: RHS repeat-associated core domain-containing protein [bacterium]